MPLNIASLRPQNCSQLKPLLLKHYYRHRNVLICDHFTSADGNIAYCMAFWLHLGRSEKEMKVNRAKVVRNSVLRGLPTFMGRMFLRGHQRLSEVIGVSFRRVESTPDPDTFGKYRDTPPISIAILLQKYHPPLGRK